MNVPADSSQSPGAVPREFSSRSAPSGHHRLPFIYFGHGPPQAAKTRLDILQHGTIEHELAAEQFRDRLARQIVERRSQAAGGDHKFGAIEAQRKASRT